MQRINSKNLVESFLDFEYQNQLFDLELNGIKIWGFIRCWVYTFLTTSCSKIDLPVKSMMRNNFYSNALKAIFYYARSTKIKKADILFIPHPRRIKQPDDKYYCIYTDFIKKALGNHYSTIALEEPYWAEYIGSKTAHFRPIPYNDLFYTDLFDITFIVKKFFVKKFRKPIFIHASNMLDDLLNKLDKFFGISISSYHAILLDLLLYITIMFKKYERIFNRIAPNLLIEFYCPGTFRNIMTYIANERNIPVIEMQHVVYATENLFYKFKYKGNYTPLPNYIFTFGDALFDQKFLPFKHVSQHVIPTGYIFLDNKLVEYQDKLTTNKKKSQILIVSQGTLNKELRKFAKDLADLLQPDDDFQIIYKKHPYEKEADYSDLQHPNITVVGTNDKDIYFYLSNAMCQVGVYSTVLYEGLRFGIPTFIIDNLYGAEQTRAILGTRNGVHYIQKPNELYKTIKSSKLIQPRNIHKEIWTPVNIDDILTTVDQIISKSQNTMS